MKCSVCASTKALAENAAHMGKPWVVMKCACGKTYKCNVTKGPPTAKEPVSKHRLPPPQFIILALDTARRSGWAIFDCGEFRVAGPATTSAHREEVVGIAVTLARSKGIPLVVGAEDWDMQGMGRASIFGLGAGFGRWEHVLEREGYDERLLFRVKVNEWRRAVLGANPRQGRDALKEMAMTSCKARGWPVQSDDAAEAALVGFYISRHEPVLSAVRTALSRTRGAFVYSGVGKREPGPTGKLS